MNCRFGVQECSLGNFVLTPIGWVCNREILSSGTQRGRPEGSNCSSGLSHLGPALLCDLNDPLESEISLSGAQNLCYKVCSDCAALHPWGSLLFHLKGMFCLCHPQAEPFPGEPGCRSTSCLEGTGQDFPPLDTPVLS